MGGAIAGRGDNSLGEEGLAFLVGVDAISRGVFTGIYTCLSLICSTKSCSIPRNLAKVL